ncbi:hypothetical protein ACFVSU_02655 [Microbacterium sp. NPDC058062]|uniref:hypothetical protein n=1 Tax=Microbacterium sp. NPDC058062 TaxID=3346320 RepID=UPI0036DDFDFB
MTTTTLDRTDPNGPIGALDSAHLRRPMWAQSESPRVRDGERTWVYVTKFVGPAENLAIATLIADGWQVSIHPKGDGVRLGFRRAGEGARR